MSKFILSVRRGVFVASMILFSSFIFLSCVKNQSDSTNTQAAGLMAFNLTPDKSAVGFTISGNNLTSAPLNYGNFTGGYVSIYPGQRVVDAVDFNAGYNSIAAANGNFDVNKFYSVFLVGADSSYRNIIVNDNLDTLAGTSGQALVRYVNAIPDSASALTVTVSANGSSVVNNPAAFATVSAFATVPAGDISIAAKNATGIDVSRTITVESKKAYTVLLTGVPGSATTPVEIKFITNGTLSDSTNKASISAQAAISN